MFVVVVVDVATYEFEAVVPALHLIIAGLISSRKYSTFLYAVFTNVGNG